MTLVLKAFAKFLFVFGVCLPLLNSALAQSSAQPKDSDSVIAEAMRASVPGPSAVKLGEQGVLKLPKDYIYIPQPQAGRMRNAMGNPGTDPDLIGLVLSATNEGWIVFLRFEKSGYIKDDDAKDWNADEMLKNFKEGTEASNVERVKLGGRELEIVGWAQKPTYDAASHRLVWAMSSKDKGAPASDQQGVNFNTYVLGREGYFSLNLVTDLNALPQFKPRATQLLSAVEFDQSKAYGDFNPATDKVAEYGLAALVVGVAAKKLGFFAVIAAFVLKFSKVFLIAFAAFGAGVFKWFSRKKS